MKILCFKTILVALSALFLVTSCNNDDSDNLYDDYKVELDNHGRFYEIDTSGRCFGATSISEDNFKKYIVGHGWKCYDTWAINVDGTRNSTSYWKNMYGVSPHDFYFDKDGTVKIYSIPNNPNIGKIYRKGTWRWLADSNEEETHLYNCVLLGTNLDNYLQIIAGDVRAFCAVELLGVGNNGQKYYGVSIYRRMTGKELADHDKNYKSVEDIQ